MLSKRVIPQRAILWIMIFTACFISYMLRVNMSINIIAMVERNATASKTHTSECSRDAGSSNTTVTPEKLTQPAELNEEKYDWGPGIQGLILGSFFWGYIITSIPAGPISERFGSKKVVGITTLLCGAFTILTPLGASWHYAVVIVLRFLVGFLSGMMYPALHCLIAKWVPPEEKGKFIGAMLGGTLGTVLTWPFLGLILSSWGWSWGFFLPGGIALVWCGLWYYCVSDTPENHPRISEDEKLYISKCIGDRISNKKKIAPYKDIFLSIPFWALAILHFGNLWGLYFLMTAGPKYISEIMGFNLKDSGILSALPYLARMIFGMAFGWIGDIIRAKNWMSVTFIRKFFVFFSSIIPGFFLIAQTFIGCNAMLSVAFITLSLGMNGASTLTNLQNSQDLAPNFAGTLYGIINCFGSTTGFITPALVGYITKEENTMAQWKIIFWIGALVYIGTGIVFMFIGTGETQYWNNLEQTNKEEDIAGVENPAFEKPVETTEQEKVDENTHI